MLLAVEPPFVQGLRHALFDGYQKLFPRERRAAPAVIVAIDEEALQRFGQWPWPRTRVAQLITGISAAKPAAIVSAAWSGLHSMRMTVLRTINARERESGRSR